MAEQEVRGSELEHQDGRGTFIATHNKGEVKVPFSCKKKNVEIDKMCNF